MMFTDLFTKLSEFLDGIGGALDGVPKAWQNVEFKPGKTIWVRFAILPGETQQVSIGSPGNNRFRTPGIVNVEIAAPLNVGDKDILSIADTLVSEARGKMISSELRVKVPYIDVLGRRDEWYKVVVTLPFRYDDLG